MPFLSSSSVSDTTKTCEAFLFVRVDGWYCAPLDRAISRGCCTIYLSLPATVKWPDVTSSSPLQSYSGPPNPDLSCDTSTDVRRNPLPETTNRSCKYCDSMIFADLPLVPHLPHITRCSQQKLFRRLDPHLLPPLQLQSLFVSTILAGSLPSSSFSSSSILSCR